jgi:signal recognition particle GTPase
MLDALTPDELNHPEKVNGIVKQRIAVASNHSVDEVLFMMHHYNQSRVMAHWLSFKQQSNETLPKSEIELHEMMTQDPRVRSISMKV